MHDSQRIKARTPESHALFERVKVATRLSAELSTYCLDETESIRTAFEELIGKPVGDSFTLIPPFYTDYGLNHHHRSDCLHRLPVRVYRPCGHRHRRPGDDRSQGQPGHGWSSRRTGQTTRVHHRGADQDRYECMDRSCCDRLARRAHRRRRRRRSWCRGDTRRPSGNTRGGCPSDGYPAPLSTIGVRPAGLGRRRHTNGWWFPHPPGANDQPFPPFPPFPPAGAAGARQPSLSSTRSSRWTTSSARSAGSS